MITLRLAGPMELLRGQCQAEVAQVLRINPKFSTERWVALHPYRGGAALERFRSALLAAGLPP